jgi:hypothetical protein
MGRFVAELPDEECSPLERLIRKIEDPPLGRAVLRPPVAARPENGNPTDSLLKTRHSRFASFTSL